MNDSPQDTTFAMAKARSNDRVHRLQNWLSVGFSVIDSKLDVSAGC